MGINAFTDEERQARHTLRLVQNPEIVPLPAPKPPNLDKTALYGPAGDFVGVLEPETEADPAAILMSLLTAFGNAIGRNTFVSVGHAKHYPNLFTAIVGRSAKARKGTSFAPIRHTLEEWNPEYAKSNLQSGLSSGEGLIHAVRDPETGVQRNRSTGEVATITLDDGVADKRLLVVETEFARTLKAMARESNTLSAVLREAWDSGNLRVMTKTPKKSTGAHISIIAHITQEELSHLLTETDALNGFANRFLWVYAERKRLLPEGDLPDYERLQEVQGRIGEAIRFGSRVFELKRDWEARLVWRQVYPDLEAEVSGLVGAVTSRASAQVLRLSMLYALLDCSETIGVRHLEAALALWRYCEDSARFIFGEAVGNSTADTILSALRESSDGLTQTEINNLFGRNLSAQRLKMDISMLVSQGLVQCFKVQTAGAPRKLWRIAEGTQKPTEEYEEGTI
jgi:hypothetical protein